MENNTPAFKKPVLIGKLPKNVTQKVNKSVELVSAETIDNDSIALAENIGESQVIETLNDEEISKGSATWMCLPYAEPPWSGSPENGSKYELEILKQGSIIGKHRLEGKNLLIFGRLPQCDISMAHPTISRYHAVLQYRKEENERDKKGYYLYDLASTHGTFLNKLRLKAQQYVRVQVGHIFKLGCSSRSYILVGPEDDQEAESEFTISELKQQRNNALARREQLVKDAELKAESERLDRAKQEEERGVDWGMGEDADVESDLAENPYAQTNNEELYIDDPKKALRGFMEREGVDFEYDCTEQGLGQFLCKVALPIDDERGRSIVAEVLHKGKKKEAVAQCALEACRILDRHGVLRQANHESKKRKAKNWLDNDYYDSDEDTFLDRTGTIERKRENRMKAKQPPQAETYQSLLEKEQTISTRIKCIQSELAASASQAVSKVSAENVDSLDSFMADLKNPKLDKDKAMQLRTELARLKQNHAQVVKLVNIARPADLPPLIAYYEDPLVSKVHTKSSKFPVFGKRLKVKVEKQGEKTVPDDSKDEDNIKGMRAEGGTQIMEVNSEIEIDYPCVEIKSIDTVPDMSGHEKGTLDVTRSASSKSRRTSSDEEQKRSSKRNQRRIAHRENKLEKEKQRGYAEDYKKQDYNMWVPPEDQTGDGKTSLNAKFGY